jgi:hypothetical protein
MWNIVPGHVLEIGHKIGEVSIVKFSRRKVVKELPKYKLYIVAV